MENQNLLQYITQNFGDELIAIAVIGALGGLMILIGKVVVGIIGAVKDKNGNGYYALSEKLKEIEETSLKGLQLATKLETNHLAHVETDIRTIFSKLEKMDDKLDALGNRITIVEVKQNNK